MAEVSAVKPEKIKVGQIDKAYRIFTQVSCLSKVDAKGRLRKCGARLICLYIGSKPEEKGLERQQMDSRRGAGGHPLLHMDKQKTEALTLTACFPVPHSLKPLQKNGFLSACVIGGRNYKMISTEERYMVWSQYLPQTILKMKTSRKGFTGNNYTEGQSNTISSGNAI